MAATLSLIGSGVIGKRHLQAMRETSRVKLLSIVDPAPAVASLAQSEGVQHFFDIDEMLANQNPDGVIVATPTEAHLTPSLRALEAGAHALIEKPIAGTLKEAIAIQSAADRANRHVLVGHHRRYTPHVTRAREIVQSGELGRLVAVSGHWFVRKPDAYYEPEYRRRWQAGPILTNLTHEIDYLRYICGGITRVQAERGHAVQGFEKEDTAALTLRFESGTLGAFVLSDQADSPWAWEFNTGENPAFPHAGQNSLRFAFTHGALDFPNLQIWRSKGAADWNHPMEAEMIPLDLGDPYIRQLEHFADVIEGKAAPIVSARDGAATLRTVLAVIDAAKAGRAVEL